MGSIGTVGAVATAVALHVAATIQTVGAVIATVGAEAYPEPKFVTVKLATLVGVRLAVTVAPEPPPPVNATVGGAV